MVRVILNSLQAAYLAQTEDTVRREIHIPEHPPAVRRKFPTSAANVSSPSENHYPLRR